jgi:hypothetical protein
MLRASFPSNQLRTSIGKGIELIKVLDACILNKTNDIDSNESQFDLRIPFTHNPVLFSDDGDDNFPFSEMPHAMDNLGESEYT